VRWYLRVSYRDVEELLAERGIEVDQSSIVHALRCDLARRDPDSHPLGQHATATLERSVPHRIRRAVLVRWHSRQPPGRGGSTRPRPVGGTAMTTRSDSTSLPGTKPPQEALRTPDMRRGGHTNFGQRRPIYSHFPPAAVAGTQAEKQSATQGDRCEPSNPDHRQEITAADHDPLRHLTS
jgi:hypothetical protein